uniref:ATP-dependent DNA helicase PIF1-like n=1 Tax=Ciona intestinalis TaxID=7719 RepID=UPI000180C10C|nr:ATP-dependent DNA helicase PIF1-like [Ciona intestinalis]|eukprot:XP_009861135.1 ATP-dependent DNA helicase PIF1-like [Ciona intestinalis]
MSENTSITCNICVESISGSKNVVKRETIKNGNLTLWRNEQKEIVLLLTRSKKETKFVLYDIQIHCKFMKEGKGSITLTNHNVSFLLSNCPPKNLRQFFKVLSVKMTRFKQQHNKITDRKKLLMTSQINEISPLNEGDIASVNKMRQTIATSKLADGINRKRKLELTTNNQTMKNAGPPPKKTMLTLKTENLNSDQKKVINLVKQGRNLFFTGSAGTGKSFLLRHIVGILPPGQTAVTASTGVAACHIGGVTLHSFAGIGSGSASIENCIQLAKSRPAVVKQWKACRHLIIDEISMISGDFFDKIEAVARAVRGSMDPFGGIQLILCGDFFQLPPVSKGKETVKLCFQSKSWQPCVDVCWELKHVYRQTDTKFIQMLQDIRIGRCTAKIEEVLKATKLNKTENNGILATQLCTHKENVQLCNKNQLEKLPSDPIVYEAQDSTTAFTDIIDKMLPDTKIITLKKGAQVMLNKNLNVGKGMVNGARGIVTGFTKSEQPLPIVRFLNGDEHTIKLECWTVKVVCDLIVVRKQIPLKLAWAISIHKSQGMSLDCVEMSLSRVFECGQAYVALSRARNLEGLRVLDFQASCVRSNVHVLRFYRRIRQEQHAIYYNVTTGIAE